MRGSVGGGLLAAGSDDGIKAFNDSVRECNVKNCGATVPEDIPMILRYFVRSSLAPPVRERFDNMVAQPDHKGPLPQHFVLRMGELELDVFEKFGSLQVDTAITVLDLFSNEVESTRWREMAESDETRLRKIKSGLLDAIIYRIAPGTVPGGNGASVYQPANDKISVALARAMVENLVCMCVSCDQCERRSA